MSKRKERRFAYLLSTALHSALITVFAYISFNIEREPSDVIELGFGYLSAYDSSGETGEESQSGEEETTAKEAAAKEEETVEDDKKTEPPTVKSDFTEKTIKKDKKTKEKDKTDKKKNDKEKKNPSDDKNKTFTDNQGKGIGQTGEGSGNSGFEIDFGGGGTRKIYSYILPNYPEGVQKEIDIKLRFTIMTDGTVGDIFPLIKADAKLEEVAINSLRKWKFEPLRASQKQVEQTAVIVFPYRLR